MSDFILILGMFMVTYSVRLLPFAMANRIQYPLWLKHALSFVPVAALSAIIAPIILLDQNDTLYLSLSNEYLLASTVAFIVAYRFKHLLLTVCSGLISFFVLKWFL